ncbi:MAG: hypothetical protein ACI30R_00045 [Sodaliphilus sp.]
MKYKIFVAIILGVCFSFADAQDFANRKAALQALERSECELGNPLSEKHDEVKYVDVLKAICRSEVLSENDKLRARLLLEQAMKNRVGEPAADIEYVTPDDSAHHLLDSKASLVLVFFNDPDCESCAIVKERMDTCTFLKDMVEAKQLEIVGIYTLDDEAQWRASSFPGYIINGWNKNQDIANHDTYLLPTLPLFYLLDSDKKVLLKAEASLNKVLDYLRMESTKNVESAGETR